MARVSLQGVCKSFGALEVVRDFSLEIEHNEFVVVVGPSGCGKSTMLRMIAGLEEISSGIVQIGDRIVNHLPPKDRNISMVFQNYALYPHMNVEQNQSFGLRIAHRPAAEIASKVGHAARLLGLSALMQRRPAQLSGGQRQRVAMGRAIVRSPEVFLFDEPLSNLDAKLRHQMRTEIKKLHQKVQATMIYVTHDQVEAMTLSDRIVVMRSGIIEQAGTPEEVFRQPASTFVAGFLGSPPMNLLPATIAVCEGRTAVQVADGLSFPLPTGLAAAVKPGTEVVAGFRPEALAPERLAGEMAEGFSFAADVELVEPLGSEVLLFLQLGSGETVEAVARLFRPRDRVRIERGVAFRIDLQELHLFDAQTGKRIGG